MKSSILFYLLLLVDNSMHNSIIASQRPLWALGDDWRIRRL
jgi:hypothetical protein